MIPYGFRDGNNNTHGAAKWATTEDTIHARLYEPGGILFGHGSQGFLTYSGKRHCMVVAPQGAGKGVGFVIPNLICYPGSMLVIDPKGENAAQTAKYRREKLGHEVFVLDPGGVTGLPSHSFNPLSWLDQSSPDSFLSEARLFAEAIIENNISKETYWTNCARSLFVALLCYVAGHTPERLNLNEIHRLAHLPLDEWNELFQTMATSNCHVEVLRHWIRDCGAWYLAQHEDHQKYHQGTLQEATHWMGNLGAQRVMDKSDFTFRDFKRKPMTVYLCIHPTEISAYRGWFRLMVTQAIKGVFENIGKPMRKVGPLEIETPILFMLDEFARAVGRLSIIDDAIPQIRDYGGRFAFILQTIGQLREMYPNNAWTTLEETCGVKVYLAAKEETAVHISNRLGMMTIQTPGSGGLSSSSRPLLFPQEISLIPEDEQICFVDGIPPMRCKRITSYLDPKIKPFLTPSNMQRRALPSSSPLAPTSLLSQVRASHSKFGAPAVTPKERKEAEHLSSPQNQSLPPEVITMLEKQYDRKIIFVGRSVGFLADDGRFVEVTVVPE